MANINIMCKSCARYGADCEGTTSPIWTGCVYRKTGLLPGDMITVHIYSGNREIITRNHGKKFIVYNKCGKLGIKWNTERSPYICEGDEFTPFSTFAQSVIFERQSDGAKFYFSNITESLKEAAQ